MRGFTCKNARRMIEEAGLRPLDAEQEATLDVHLAICADCRREAEMWLNLRRTVRTAPLPPLPPHVEQRLLNGEEPAMRHAVGPSPVRWVAAAATAAVAAGIVLAILWLPDWRTVDDTEAIPVTSDGVAEDGALPPHTESEPPQRVEGAASGTDLWIRAGSTVEVARNDRSATHVSLGEGFVLARIGPNDPGFRFVVETPETTVTALGTLFSVTTSPGGELVVRVTEGTVEVQGKADPGTVRRVLAGQEFRGFDRPSSPAPAIRLQRDLAFAGLDSDEVEILTVVPHGLPPVSRTPVHPFHPAPGETAPSSGTPSDDGAALLEGGGEDHRPGADTVQADAVPSLDMLLGIGHAHHLSGDFERTCETYEQLMTLYPDSDHARTMRITVAQLQLAELGRPGQALSHFDRYLEVEPNGPLVEEARVGRVRALFHLGRYTATIEAAAIFEAAHPDSRACSEVFRLRGDAHRELGEPALAAAAYEELLRRWPSSNQAGFARAGLAACQGSR